MPSALEHQRAAAALMLAGIRGDDFALAGSSAIREHGLIDRPTLDIDLFTIQTATDRFSAAVERSVATLTEQSSPRDMSDARWAANGRAGMPDGVRGAVPSTACARAWRE